MGGPRHCRTARSPENYQEQPQHSQLQNVCTFLVGPHLTAQGSLPAVLGMESRSWAVGKRPAYCTFSALSQFYSFSLLVLGKQCLPLAIFFRGPSELPGIKPWPTACLSSMDATCPHLYSVLAGTESRHTGPASSTAGRCRRVCRPMGGCLYLTSL